MMSNGSFRLTAGCTTISRFKEAENLRVPTLSQKTESAATNQQYKIVEFGK